jgi:hypothetical protein
MKHLSERIAYTTDENELTIYIKASKTSDLKNIRLLKFWLILWSLAGIVIASQLFVPNDREVKLFIFVYLTFWGYFLYKAANAYYFLRYGTEVAYVHHNKFITRRDILKKKGSPRFFTINQKNPFRSAKDEMSGIQRAYYGSFWVVSGGDIAFGEKKHEYRFGIHLEENEIRTLVKMLNHHFKPAENQNS